MSTVLLGLGGVWIVLGLLTFWSAWFGALQKLDLIPGQTATEILMVQLSVAKATSLDLILTTLLISFGVLFVVASRLPLS